MRRGKKKVAKLATSRKANCELKRTKQTGRMIKNYFYLRSEKGEVLLRFSSSLRVSQFNIHRMNYTQWTCWFFRKIYYPLAKDVKGNSREIFRAKTTKIELEIYLFITRNARSVVNELNIHLRFSQTIQNIP